MFCGYARKAPVVSVGPTATPGTAMIDIGGRRLLVGRRLLTVPLHAHLTSATLDTPLLHATLLRGYYSSNHLPTIYTYYYYTAVLIVMLLVRLVTIMTIIERGITAMSVLLSLPLSLSLSPPHSPFPPPSSLQK